MKGTQRKTVACPSFKIILFIYSILNYFLCVWVFACLQVCVANVHLVPVRTRRELWIPQTVATPVSGESNPGILKSSQYS